MKVAVSIGHRPGRPGFRAGKYTEYAEMAPVVGNLIQALSYNDILVYSIGTGILQNKVAHINKLNVDLAVELHLNAGGGHGAETLYCPGSESGKPWAQSIQDQMTLLGMRDRGIKEGWYRMNPDNGPDYFLAKTNCPAVITEAYFLDNPNERRAYAGNVEFYRLLAFNIASGIKNMEDKL